MHNLNLRAQLLVILFLYSLIYSIGAVLNLSPEVLKMGMYPAHFISVVFFLHVVWQSWKLQKIEIVYWLILFLIFYIPGAYLEWPSDSWEHYRRIMSWNAADSIRGVQSWYKAYYFWMWSIFGSSEIKNHLPILNFVSAFFQWLVAIGVFCLSLSLGYTRKVSFLFVLLFLGTFGVNVFGLRYYALSSTMPAYATMAVAISLALDEINWKSRRFVCFQALAGFVMLTNHLQELLLWIVNMTTLFFIRSHLFEWFKTQNRWKWALTGGFAFGLIAHFFVPSIYNNVGIYQISEFGSFKIWHSSYRFREAYGAIGYFTLLGAFFLFKIRRELSALTLAPALLLTYPPTVAILALALPDHGVPYRLIYAFPICFALYESVQHVLNKFNIKASIASFIVLIVLSFVPHFPIYGRMAFQLSNSNIDTQTAQLLRVMPEILSKTSSECRPIMDDWTRFVLFAQTGISNETRRLNPHIYDPADFWERRDTTIKCGVLLPPSDRCLLPTYLGQLSGHWNYQKYCTTHMYNNEFLQLVDKYLPQKIDLSFGYVLQKE